MIVGVLSGRQTASSGTRESLPKPVREISAGDVLARRVAERAERADLDAKSTQDELGIRRSRYGATGLPNGSTKSPLALLTICALSSPTR